MDDARGVRSGRAELLMQIAAPAPYLVRRVDRAGVVEARGNLGESARTPGWTDHRRRRRLACDFCAPESAAYTGRHAKLTVGVIAPAAHDATFRERAGVRAAGGDLHDRIGANLNVATNVGVDTHG